MRHLNPISAPLCKKSKNERVYEIEFESRVSGEAISKREAHRNGCVVVVLCSFQISFFSVGADVLVVSNPANRSNTYSLIDPNFGHPIQTR